MHNVTWIVNKSESVNTHVFLSIDIDPTDFGRNGKSRPRNTRKIFEA